MVLFLIDTIFSPCDSWQCWAWSLQVTKELRPNTSSNDKWIRLTSAEQAGQKRQVGVKGKIKTWVEKLSTKRPHSRLVVEALSEKPCVSNPQRGSTFILFTASSWIECWTWNKTDKMLRPCPLRSTRPQTHHHFSPALLGRVPNLEWNHVKKDNLWRIGSWYVHNLPSCGPWTVWYAPPQFDQRAHNPPVARRCRGTCTFTLYSLSKKVANRILSALMQSPLKANCSSLETYFSGRFVLRSSRINRSLAKFDPSVPNFGPRIILVFFVEILDFWIVFLVQGMILKRTKCRAWSRAPGPASRQSCTSTRWDPPRRFPRAPRWRSPCRRRSAPPIGSVSCWSYRAVLQATERTFSWKKEMLRLWRVNKMMEEVSVAKRKWWKTDHSGGFVLWLHGRRSCERKRTSEASTTRLTEISLTYLGGWLVNVCCLLYCWVGSE